MDLTEDVPSSLGQQEPDATVVTQGASVPSADWLHSLVGRPCDRFDREFRRIQHDLVVGAGAICVCFGGAANGAWKGVADGQYHILAPTCGDSSFAVRLRVVGPANRHQKVALAVVVLHALFKRRRRGCGGAWARGALIGGAGVVDSAGAALRTPEHRRAGMRAGEHNGGKHDSARRRFCALKAAPSQRTSVGHFLCRRGVDP